jgi:hypothetical protein
MAHQHTDEPSDTSDAALKAAVTTGYEPNDVRLRSVFVFIGVLVITLVVVLTAIYGIMMALAEHDRASDPIASPIAVKLPAVYAPLQPSLGFYGDSKNDHDTLDAEDMIAMRYRAEQELNAPAGTTEAGRRHMPIESAIDTVLPLLVLKPAIAPVVEPTYPAGSREGYYPDPNKKSENVDPSVHRNSMDRLIVDN